MTETAETTEKAENPRTWKESLLLAAAIGGGTLVVAGIAAVIFLLSLPTTTGLDLLPASRTIIMIAGDDAAAMAVIKAAAPNLPAPPQTGSGLIAALISVNDNQGQWIVLPRGHADVNDDTLAIPPAIRAIIKDSPALVDEPLFGALSPTADFIFFANVPWLRANAGLHPFAAAALSDRNEVALTKQAGRWQLSTDGSAPNASLDAHSALAFPSPLFAAAGADLPSLFQTVASWQQPDAALITQGLLRALIGRTFGPHALSGAVLSSLAQTQSLAIEATGTGALRFAVDMTVHSASGTALEPFARSFADSFPQTMIVKHVLDKDYSITDARLDPNAVERTESDSGNWHLTTLSHSGSLRRLSLAESALDGHLLAGSDPDAIAPLLPALAGPDRWPVLSSDGILVAAGELRPDLLRPLLPPSTTLLLSRGLLTQWPQTSLIRWNLTTNHGIWSVIADLAL